MNAREKCHQILCEIMLNKQYANLVLRKELNNFSDADKALMTNIVYGTMQNYLYLRYQWEYMADKKMPKDMGILMDMSLYQLIFMDKLPDYAIVNESVEAAKKLHKGHYASMINALLRRFIRDGLKEVEGSEIEKLSILTSHPVWLIQMWNKQYGFDITKKICQDNQKTPRLACRVNTLKTTNEKILFDNPRFMEGKLSKDALIYDSGNIADTKEYLSGQITIQDEASQCVALLLDPKENECILDACSAPGTKTTHIAQLMKDHGKIVALDLHEHRVSLIENSCRRLSVHCVEARQMDATHCQTYFEKESFDRILVDAPCSGYGVMKRKNDIKVHMESNDMDEIIQIQKKILESVSSLLKQNGVLVYSTCTLNKKENEKQIEAFLKNHEEYECLSMRTIFPFEFDCDGFFMAKLIKKQCCVSSDKI